MQRISKTLSANDVGATGGHQAGIHIPKNPELLSFFPYLNPEERNPRVHIIFSDYVGQWELAFIYYNNARFGGTRDEYRLTRLTRYIREASLEAGDEIHLSRTSDDQWRIGYSRYGGMSEPDEGFVLRLGAGWKVVNV